MPTRIAINGFGRIGRAAFKIALTRKDIEVVAINDLMDNKTLAHLLKYDTVYGEQPGVIQGTKEGIKVDGRLYPVFNQKDPSQLPWAAHRVDVVLECTGIFKTTEAASAHLRAGAKRVVISAPAKDETQTMVLGTKDSNERVKTGKHEKIVSMASCTTNCISPVMQVLESKFGIEKAMMTTVHAYTSTQNLVDGPSKDLRRARAAAQNIIPTSTGAAIATTKVVKSLNNLFDGIALRVPVITGSVSDITAVLKKKTVTVEEINDEFKQAVKNPAFKNVLAVSDKPLVSSDFVKSPYSSIVDLEFTRVVGGNMVKILAWYDNEWGYSTRLIDIAGQIGKLIK
ncbi:MAG: type I glyceraldehyde-3-phosphate dehydrogenase [Candidatus Buchananbacteria bacterium]|nr:type I glyceraldehyde-3-phosphate dehydrogenase [Candidatus Buchananbacteria bacterium]